MARSGYRNLKKYVLIIAPIIIVGMSLVYYYYEYKDHRISLLFGVALFVGWCGIFFNIAGHYLTAPKILWKNNKAGMLKQALGRLAVYAAIVGLIFGSAYLVITAEENREKDIMTNQPTAFTTALVTDIVKTHTRNTYYHARLQYTVNGKVIFQETPDNSGYLKAGETYKLKYSVNYPEMFVIYGR